MATSRAHNGDKKKIAKDLTAVEAREQPQHNDHSSGRKRSLQPDIKREYELLERYIQNFSGSSF